MHISLTLILWVGRGVGGFEQQGVGRSPAPFEQGWCLPSALRGALK